MSPIGTGTGAVVSNGIGRVLDPTRTEKVTTIYPVTAKEILNYTNHQVTVVDDNNRVIAEWSANAKPAHIVNGYQFVDAVLDPVFHTPITCKKFGLITGLPEERSGTFLIVSGLMADALPNRKDLLIPDTGRDALRVDGEIMAVRRLIAANVKFMA